MQLSFKEIISYFFQIKNLQHSLWWVLFFHGGSICKNSAVLFAFRGFYGIIIFGSYLLDKLKFAGEIMIILITGASHTGKTALAQKLLEKYKYPYLSIDHLKMGLIRSGNTELTPISNDSDLTAYLWPIVREMIKTAIENKQNLIVEGCYIPYAWQKDFNNEYLESIKYYCLVMSERYIRNHFEEIKKYANIIENRLDDDGCTIESALADNVEVLSLAQKHNVNYILIEDSYEIDVDL